MKTESNINEVTEEITDHGGHCHHSRALEMQQEEWAKHKWGKGDHVPEHMMLEKIVHIEVTLRYFISLKRKDKMLEPDLDLEGIWEFGKA